jgi:hypothetical protein
MARVVKGLGVQHFALLSTSDNKGKRLDDFREWNVFPIFFPSQAYDRIEQFLSYLAEPQTAAAQSLDAAVVVSRQLVAPSVRHRCGCCSCRSILIPESLWVARSRNFAEQEKTELEQTIRD